MGWLIIPAIMLVGAYFYGKPVLTIQLVPPAAPQSGPKALNGDVILLRSLVLVNGLDATFQTVEDFPHDLGPFVPLGTAIGSTLSFRILSITSVRGPAYVQASVDDPRISLQGVFDIPLSSIVSVLQ